MYAVLTFPIKKKQSTGNVERLRPYSGWIGVPDNWIDRLGFIYIIRNTANGRFYIGKKLFRKAGKRMGKKVAEISNWQKYYGSSKELQEEITRYGKNNFEREILQCFDSKSDMAFAELLYQIKYCIKNKLSYNSMVNVRLFIRESMRNIEIKEDIICTKTKQNCLK